MMLSEMTMSEYIHWNAIYSIEPFPEERADMRAAEQLRMMLIIGHAKQIPDIAELMPDWWGERQARAQTPEQIKANLNIIKAATKKRKK